MHSWPPQRQPPLRKWVDEMTEYATGIIDELCALYQRATWPGGAREIIQRAISTIEQLEEKNKELRRDIYHLQKSL